LTKVKLLLLLPLMAVALLLAKIGGFSVFLAVLLLIAIGDWKLATTRLTDGEVRP
jgi:hypothetical protein